VKIAVTGSTGLVGSHLVRHLRARGHELLLLERRPGPGAARFDLEAGLEGRPLEGCQALIHCAHDFKAATWPAIEATNVRGSIKLFEAARAQSVERLVFVSTVSAFEGCRSLYGKGKLLVEEFVKSVGGVSVRPGLVHGDPAMRGIYGSLARLSRLPVLPVPSGGRQPMVLVHVEDLAVALEAATTRPGGGGLFVAAHPSVVTLREILLEVARRNGRRPWLVWVPAWPGLVGLGLAEKIGLKLPFRKDSLVGLLYGNKAYDFARPAWLGELSFRGFLGGP
jgi:nucleoside-diphosphate-sugar epimerase